MYDPPTSQSENKMSRGPSYLNAVSIKVAQILGMGMLTLQADYRTHSWRAELEKSFPWLKELTLSNSVLF